MVLQDAAELFGPNERPLADGWDSHKDLSRATGGLTDAAMLHAARQAGLRPAIGKIAQSVADLWMEIGRL